LPHTPPSWFFRLSIPFTRLPPFSWKVSTLFHHARLIENEGARKNIDGKIVAVCMMDDRHQRDGLFSSARQQLVSPLARSNSARVYGTRRDTRPIKIFINNTLCDAFSPLKCPMLLIRRMFLSSRIVKYKA
jgi:hypothetical protein